MKHVASRSEYDTKDSSNSIAFCAPPHLSHLADLKQQKSATEVERGESRNQIANSLGGVVF
jgi:hypothetical protein